MSFINKPRVSHPDLPKNSLGLTRREYEGAMSTLCAGCGHDSVTASIIEAIWGLSIRPEQLAKFSGIGCSSKTTAYFASGAHGFNGVHGRMPSIATGANAANRNLHYIGVSGDGDSLSIGMGQFAHVIRRNLNMCYIIENNGVYGLTKGQYSASADVGSVAKKQPANRQMPIDPVSTAIGLGATYIARSFSGDKQQLVPLIKGAITHKGFALLDVISPCVTFNDNAGSTKSYAYTRQHFHHVIDADYIAPSEEILASYNEGEAMPVRLHDGSKIVFRKLNEDYDPTSRAAAFSFLRDSVNQGEIITGLLYINESPGDMHSDASTVDTALANLDYKDLNPGRQKLAELMSRYR
jgi:2-oxoglutarate ferredoxin oxidoreductase subunit beta